MRRNFSKRKRVGHHLSFMSCIGGYGLIAVSCKLQLPTKLATFKYFIMDQQLKLSFDKIAEIRVIKRQTDK